MSAKTIIFCNQKGGVGKTTLSRNLGYYLAQVGLKMLLIDVDGQGNLSLSFFDESNLNGSCYEALTGGEVKFQEITNHLNLLCSDSKLSSLEKQLVGEIDGHSRLKELLNREELSDYDLVFIDSPPSLGMLTTNGLAACDYLIIPLNPKLYSMQGCNKLMETVTTVRKTFNNNLQVLGFVINGYDKRLAIHREIKSEIEATYGEWVFKTSVSECVKLEESIALACGVTDLRGSGTFRVRRQIEELSKEILERLGMKTPVTVR